MKRGTIANPTCPWWLMPLFENPARHWIHPARRILERFVKPGDVVVEPGCGTGHFTTTLAALTGPEGRVHSLDVLQWVLCVVRARVAAAGLLDRVEVRRCNPRTLEVQGPVDFVLGFWMVHEVPDRATFLAEIHGMLRSGGTMLVVEPRGHVRLANFEQTLAIARSTGFRIEPSGHVFMSRTALLVRP